MPETSVDKDPVDDIVNRWKDVRPDIDAASTHIVGRLLRLEYFINRQEAEALKPYRLNPGEFNALASLRRAGEPYALTPGQLQDTLLVSSGALTNRIDRLVTAGYVSRFPDPNDRRSVVVQLTRAGLETVDRAIDAILTAERELIVSLTKAERTAMELMLRKLLGPFEETKRANGTPQRGRR